MTAGEARVWDARDATTTCSQVVVLLCKPENNECTNACDSSFVDDLKVRPTDHIPLTVVITIT